jgi:hypothetical protein
MKPKAHASTITRRWTSSTRRSTNRIVTSVSIGSSTAPATPAAGVNGGNPAAGSRRPIISPTVSAVAATAYTAQ